MRREHGERPEVDCGDDSIIVFQDKEVDCLLTGPSTGTEFDTTVTFTVVPAAELARSAAPGLDVTSDPG